MMNNSSDKTLLTLLLTLNDLENPLSQAEKEALSDVADNLALDPDAWESEIEPELFANLEKNAALWKQFLDIKSRIEAVGEIPKELLPNLDDSAEVSNQTAVVTRGFAPVGEVEEFETNEINNMALSVLSSPEPEETVKQVTKLGALKKFLFKKIV